MRTLAKILGYGLVLLFVVAALGFAYKYTNGFTDDLKTFYIEYDGKQILTTENKMTLQQGDIHRFDVKYTFDKDDAEPKGYKVKIVKNMTRDFDFTVDGEKYIFSKVGDLTNAFELEQSDTFFELYLPENLSFSEVLKKAYNGNSVSVPADAFTNNPYPYRLQILSYNDKVTYNIDFTFGDSGSSGSGQSSGGNNNTPSTPDIPPAVQYAIQHRVTNNDAGLVYVSTDIPSSSEAGKTVKFVVQLLDDYHCSVAEITVMSGGKRIAYALPTGNPYEYSFAMPEKDVEVVIALTDIVVSNFYSIGYDTLGSGSVDSVMFYCNDVAAPGDWVTSSIYLTPDEENRLEITNVVLQNADTGDDIEYLENFNDLYEFTMPNCNVNIMIYLMPKGNQSSGTVETPSTPTGATHSIIYSATYGDYDSAFDFTDFVSVDCPSIAVSGDKVTVKISITDSFAELYEITDVMISYPEMEFSYAFAVSKGNGVYEFTMPDFDMQLYIYVGDKSCM